MRVVQFSSNNIPAEYPANFSSTRLIETTYVGEYTGVDAGIINYTGNYGVWPNVGVQSSIVTWTDAQPQGGGTPSVLMFSNNYNGTGDAMLVVQAGDVGMALHPITITAQNNGDAGSFVVPIKHIQSATDFTETGPRIAMTVTKLQGNNTVTCTVTFQQSGYYLMDEDCLNEKYIGAYSCKPLMIRVVS